MSSNLTSLHDALGRIRRSSTARILEYAERHDAVLLDGQLVPRAEARRRHWRLRLRGWLALTELAVSWLIVAYAGTLALFLLVYLTGPLVR